MLDSSVLMIKGKSRLIYEIKKSDRCMIRLEGISIRIKGEWSRMGIRNILRSTLLVGIKSSKSTSVFTSSALIVGILLNPRKDKLLKLSFMNNLIPVTKQLLLHNG